MQISPLVTTLMLCTLLVGCGTTPATKQVALQSEGTATQSTSSQSDKFVEPPNRPAASPEDSALEEAHREPVHNPAAEVKAVEYTVRKSVTPSTVSVSGIPPVLLSASHAKLCAVKVGDSLPEWNLPNLAGQTTPLATLRGKQGTVVLFWHPDRWMARTALIDMQRDIASKFPVEQVAVVGIPVQQSAKNVRESLTKAQATFPQLLDTKGEAFAAVGTLALPRIYVLDPAGKIVWFDIEYSEGTRRELGKTLEVLTEQ